MRHRLIPALACGLTAGLWAPAPAHALEDGLYRLTDAIMQGKIFLDLRYRYESVDQDDPASIMHDADAHTVRTRLGYRTGLFYDFQAFIEAENVHQITNDYNNTYNGKADYPVVADPGGTEVNQSYLQYLGIKGTTLRAGRQVIAFDNHRWVGDVGWRQNQQVFDGFFAENIRIPGLAARYAYVSNANRIFGEETPSTTFATTSDFHMSSHLLNVQYKWNPVSSVTGYGYLLDFDDFDVESTSTYGLRVAGEFPFATFGGSFGGGSFGGGTPPSALLYTAEYARQSDYADNPDSFNLDYGLAELGVRLHGVALKGGYELLEGGGGEFGTRALQTPLATMHAFNGWADQFLRTPGDGLEDRYLTLGGPIPKFGMDWLVRYDDYRADSADIDYGHEWGAQLTKVFAERYTLGIKYAHYVTDFDAFVPGAAFTTDVNKLWVWAQLKI